MDGEKVLFVGKGLGKNESGMVEALKPKLKFDTTGIGHDHAQQFTFNWWEIAFNDAAKRVSVNPSKDNSIGQLNTNALCISTKPPSVTKLLKENPLRYGNFIKTETLKNGGEVVPVRRKSTTAAEEDSSRITLSNLSDEELFKICGGRTAHKAARHGHKLVGKLARVIEQEKEQLSASSGKEKEDHLEVKTNVNVVANGEEHIRIKKKRKKKLVEVENEKSIYERLAIDNEVMEPSASESGVSRDRSNKGDKERRKKKKMVLDVEVTSPVKVCSEGSKSKKKKRCKSECNYLTNDDSEQISKGKRDAFCEEHMKRQSKKKRR
ncbi:G patch domain-containing protein 4-like isoform X2 [Hetaerina americana]|uniref:G patch domain-containing protein 4-like isoform X2 n=1 Tax=Hetaerina americana TaxID=62018 RepID=UPI003A7F56A4